MTTVVFINVYGRDVMTVVGAGWVESQIIRDNLRSDAEFQRQLLGELPALYDMVGRVQGNLRVL